MVKKTIDPHELGRTTPLRILVCGDRNWTDIDLIEKVLSEYTRRRSSTVRLEARIESRNSSARSWVVTSFRFQRGGRSLVNGRGLFAISRC